jgi:sulfur carrier protein ThiS
VGINPVTVLVKRNDMLVPVEETVKDGDVIELIPVVSGG